MGKSKCDFNLLQSISGLDQNSTDECLQLNSKVYIQYICERSDKHQKTNLKIALFVAITAIYISYVFLYIFYFAEKKAKMDYQIWDFENATVADFSV